MGLFAKFIPSFLQRSTPANPDKWLSEYFNGGIDTESGVAVDEYNALTFSAVYACITLISETVASLPLILYRKRADGGRERATDHYLYPLLHDAFNDEMSSFTFRDVMQGHLLSWGNCYGKIKQDGQHRAEDVSILSPDKTEVLRVGPHICYDYTQNGETTRLFDDQILHIPGFGFNGLIGKSPIAMARESIGLGLAAEQFGSKFFGNGANPGLIFEHPGKLGDEALKRLRESITQAYSGLGNAHKALITEEGMKTTRTTIPPNDAQFLETRKFQKNEICSIYRVPPFMIGDVEKQTSWGTGIEQQQIGFITHTIRPWLIRWEQEITRKMMSAKDRKAGYYVEFLVDGLLRGDSTARGEFYSKLFNVGAMSINDIREKENMNPIENGGKHFVPMNFMPIDRAVAEPVAEPVAAPVDEEVKKKDNTIEKRIGVIGVGKSHKKKLDKAFGELVQHETSNLRKLFKINRKNTPAPQEMIDDFYKAMPATVKRKVQFAVFSYQDDVSFEAQSLIGKGGGGAKLRKELEKFKTGYINSLSDRYTGTSKKQLATVLNNTNANELISKLSAKLDLWDSEKAQQYADEELVRAGNAVARENWSLSGVTKLVWVTQGSKSCPFCKLLDGKVVGIDKPFLGDGDTLTVTDGNNWMKMSGKKMHPPIHRGCVCAIMPVTTTSSGVSNKVISEIAKKAEFTYQESKVGASVTAEIGKSVAKTEALDDLLDILNNQVVPDGKQNNVNFIKSSLENMKDKGFGGVVQFNKDGSLYSAGTFDSILSDSVHIDTFGGLGQGTGESVLYRIMEYSKNVAGKDGRITLYAEGSPATIKWYAAHGFDSKPGAGDGRIFMNKEPHITGFMDWFEENKIK